MQPIKLENQKIQKMREYHYISIPKAFIDNGLLSIEKKYRITLEEIKDNLNASKNQKTKVLEESS